MYKVCDQCKKSYDDAKQSTICNHADLLPEDDFNRKQAAFKLMGKKVMIKSSGRIGTVTSIEFDGTIAVDGQGGFSANDLTEQRSEPDYRNM